MRPMTLWRSAVAVLCLLALAVPAAAAESLPDNGLDDAVLIGQMVLIGFRGATPDDPGAMRVREDIRAGRVGGVILFDKDVARPGYDRNVISPAQVQALTGVLQGDAEIPLLIAVDQEGGRVNRFKPERGFPPLAPSAQDLGALGDPVATGIAARTIGELLAATGVNLDFAPVVDLNVNPESPAIGALGRSFSADPGAVAMHGAEFVQGLHESGVYSCLKHFPGHGSARGDTHQGLTDVTATWTAAELDPYRRLIAQGRADMVMTAHIVNRDLDPLYPASLSRAVTTDLLRGELGFDGVIVTDDLQMGAITEHYSLEETVALALDAGADILLFGNNLEYDPDIAIKVQAIVLDLLAQGRVTRERLEASYERIMALKHP